MTAKTIATVTASFLTLAATGLAQNANEPKAGQVPSSVDQKPDLVSLTHQTPRQIREGTATLIGAYKPEQTLRVTFGLRPPHMDEEKQFLEELHTKGSPNFMKFLTQKEWIARFAPSAEDEQAVVDWAQSQGLTVTQRYPNRLLVDTEAPVGNIQKALSISINSYQIAGAPFFSNDRDPLIPVRLAHVIESVGGLNNIQVMRPANRQMKEPVFPDYSPGPVVSKATNGGGAADRMKVRQALSRSAGLGGLPGLTNGAYDPPDMWSSYAYDTNALYNQGHCCNVPGNAGGSPPESSIAVATAGTQDPNDFAGFHNQYPYLAWHYFLIYIGGTPTCCDEEGTMDFEWATAMSNSFGSLNDTASVYMYDGVDNQFSTFNTIYNQMLTDGNARVMSTSWGWDETDVTSLVSTTDNIFSEMIGEGWTLIAASGDGGASYACRASDAVSFPASDPNVVAAGGTTLYLNADSSFNSVYGWSGGPDGCGTNDGGSTGGVSITWPAPGYQGLPSGNNRQVPDVALNADWYHTPQNIFFAGGLSGNGGTSIVAPEMAGFFAQVNAYLDYVGNITGGCYGGGSCAKIGNGNWYLYYFGQNPGYAPHYPFYDVTSGCNNNDITAEFGLGYFCAGSGYDMVTGWGMVNMLQLSWAINTYRAGDFGAPVASFSGPATGIWYNTDQTVSWTLRDTSGNGNPATGVAGFTQAWDSDPGDVSSEPTPGWGNSFYSGPEFPNATSGSLDVAPAGQGCHSVNLRAWDNTGVGSGDLTYGPVCYDTVAPVSSATLSPSPNVFGWDKSAVSVALLASDPAPGSGVSATYYSIDNSACGSGNLASCLVYGGSFTITSQGSHVLYFFSRDHAGNFEARHTIGVKIDETAPHTTATLSGTKNGTVFITPVKVTLTATDNLSGIASTVYQIDGGSLHAYTAPFTISALGSHKVTFHSTDKAGNVETTESVSFAIKSNTATSVVSSLNPSTKGKALTFTATVTGSGATLSGSVQFKNGTTVLATVALNTTTHRAAATTSTLAVGTHSITAVYEGNADFEPSTSAVLKQVVNP